MATMKDIAEIAQVSTATVSHVINGTKNISAETRERVYQAIKRVNYVPNSIAKSLRIGSSRTIGVLVEDIRGLPVAGIVNGIGEALELAGYTTLLYDLQLLEKLYNQYEQIGVYRDKINGGINLLLQSNVDGVIYVGMHDRHLDGLISPIKRPLVFAYSHGSTEESFVSYSNRQSASDVVDLLIAHGHKRIGVIAGHPHSYPTMIRLDGYQLSLQKHALNVDTRYIRYGDWEYESGLKEAKALMALPDRPTAIFAMNDLMGIGCIHAITDMGLRVPEDISVAGFDDRECASYVRPRLTTVSIPTKEIGIRAAEMLCSMIGDGHPVAEGKLLPCQIVVRDSVAKASDA